MTERQNLISFIKLAMPMGDNKASEIAENFEPVSLNKNDFLLREGSVCNDYFFLEKGFMRAYTFDTEGNEVTTNFYERNSIVFEVASYIKRTPSQENIQALTDCFGWKGNYTNLQSLFHTSPEFRGFVREILVNNFIGLKERTLSMINLTAEKRYEILLKSRREIIQNVSIKHIASYLGITDTSLSRIRKEIAIK
ncbi:MAG: Crp/Fnr family transcriptional regulator [Bacteroidota bacterium]